MNNLKLIILAILVTAPFMSISAIAEGSWTLQSEQSTFNFVSTKNTHIAEVFSFTEMSGSIGGSGDSSGHSSNQATTENTVRAQLALTVGSIKTGIDIRDQRVKEHLLKSDLFPTIIARLDLPDDLLDEASVGQSMNLSVTADVSLLEQTYPVTALLSVTSISENTVMVTTAEPILLNVSNLGMAQGIAKLAELAGGVSIGYSVPVTFELRFEK